MNFTIREPFAASLSTGAAGRTYKPGMSQTLKSYFEAERGRQTRLAEALGVSRGYLSDIANGKKEGSVDTLRRIADLTGLDMNDLVGRPPGLAEGQATPYTPGPRTNRMRDMVGMLFPSLRNPSYYIATVDQPAFGILHGDLLVLETSFAPEKIEPGKLIVAQAVGDNAEGQTMVSRLAQPWLIDGTGNISAEVEVTAAIVGLIQIVVRSADPSAF